MPQESHERKAEPGSSTEAAVPDATEPGGTGSPPGEPDQLGCGFQEGVDRIIEAFERKLAYDHAKQVQIDRLHEELSQHRANAATRAYRPLVMGMIQLHGKLGRLLASARDTSGAAPFEDLREDVELLLEQFGITTYREAGDTFDPRRQKVFGKIATEDPLQAGKVMATLAPGFEQGAELLEKERVALYEYKATAPDTTSPSRQEAQDS